MFFHKNSLLYSWLQGFSLFWLTSVSSEFLETVCCGLLRVTLGPSVRYFLNSLARKKWERLIRLFNPFRNFSEQDRYGLGSNPGMVILLLCPWERHFAIFFSARRFNKQFQITVIQYLYLKRKLIGQQYLDISESRSG